LKKEEKNLEKTWKKLGKNLEKTWKKIGKKYGNYNDNGQLR
jgi:hypothetical protein